MFHPWCGLRRDPAGAPAVRSDAELVMLSRRCWLGRAVKFLSPEIKPVGEFYFWPSCARIPLPFRVWGVSGYLHRVHSAGTAATPGSRGVCVWEQEAASCALARPRARWVQRGQTDVAARPL